METRLPVRIEPGPSVVVAAALETGGGVRVAWATRAGTVKPGNLFVPCFTSARGRPGPPPAAPRTIADHRRLLSRR